MKEMVVIGRRNFDNVELKTCALPHIMRQVSNSSKYTTRKRI
jgi:hypothetical protein